MEQSQCLDFIQALPNGIDTVIGDKNGFSLSGGQKQRVALARSFLKPSSLLILDEATASLDALTDQAIYNYLSNLSESKSLILVTHQLKHLSIFDRIYFLEKGSCIAQGSHEKLLKTLPQYSKMNKT